MLRARNSRREEPIGVHLPDPIIERADGMALGVLLPGPGAALRDARADREDPVVSQPLSDALACV